MNVPLRALTWTGMAIFLLVILVPFWWIASMSFKTYEQIQFATSIYFPNPFTWENYTGLWTETRFPTWLRNSLVTGMRDGMVTLEQSLSLLIQDGVVTESDAAARSLYPRDIETRPRIAAARRA